MIKDYLERYKNNVLQLGMILKEQKIYELECIEAASLPAMTINGMPKGGTKQDLSSIINRYEDLLSKKHEIVSRLQDEIIHVQILVMSLQLHERYIIECKYWHRLGWDTIARKMTQQGHKIDITREGAKRLYKRTLQKLEAQEQLITG